MTNNNYYNVVNYNNLYFVVDLPSRYFHNIDIFLLYNSQSLKVNVNRLKIV